MMGIHQGEQEHSQTVHNHYNNKTKYNKNSTKYSRVEVVGGKPCDPSYKFCTILNTIISYM